MFHRPIPRPPGKARHRLFFALIPPIVTARQIANAAPWLDAKGATVAADRLHVTMFILDDFLHMPPPLLIEALRAVGDAVEAPPIEIVFDRASGGTASLALRPSHRNAALDALHRQIDRLCAAAGITQREGYSFNPHMTLGYRQGRAINGPVSPVAWTATELVLIHSHLGKTRHDRLASWPLDADQAQGDLFG